MSKSLKILKIFGATVIGFGVVAATLVSITHNHTKSVVEVNATSHPDNFASYTYSGSYYNSISSTASEGTDGSLRTSLTTLIHPTTVPTYSSSGETHLSTVLQYADEDPTNSSNMIYLYTRDSVKKNAASSWNREHVWPQSLSNSCWGTGRAGTDLLHLRPTYNTTNSTRGNLKYGEISGGAAKVYNGITYGYTSGSYFMPLDSVKGDVARIIMYVWVSYYNEYGNKLPAITNVFQSFDVLMSWHCSDKPDVMEGNRNNYSETSMQKNRNPFVDHPEYAWKIFGSQCSSSVLANAKTTYPADGSSSGTTSTVSLNTSAASINVGGSVSLTATSSDSSAITWSKNNSNVNLSSTSGNTITVSGVTAGSSIVYATNASGAKASCSITVTSSGGGQGTEGSDVTIDFREGGNCQATSGSFENINFSTAKNSSQTTPAYNSAGELRMYYASNGSGNSFTLTPATNYTITKVVLTASSTSYTPTVKYNIDGGNDVSGSWSSATMTMSGFEASSSFTFRNANTSNTQLRIATVDVTLVTSVTRTLSSISVSEMTTTFMVGDQFTFDGTCTATYSSGSPRTVTPSSVSSPNMSTAGTKTVTVTYTESGITKTTTYEITVNTPATLSSLSKSGTLSKTSYYDGDAFDPTGLTITATYSDGSTKNVTNDVAWTPSPLTAGTTSVVGTYGGKTISVSGFTVQALTLSSVAVSGQTTTYIVGDIFGFDGSVIATYTNGSKKQVEATSVDESAVNMNAEGTYVVRVSYSENGITRSATYTISVNSVPFVNSIEECYSKSKGASCNDVYGLYVGSFNNGQSSMIMNGEYGIMLYQKEPESTWKENQTYLHITSSSLDIYNNLYELKNVSVSTITDAAVIRQNVAPITVYTVDGNESTNDLTVANRLCLMSGEVTSITHKSSNQTVSGWKNDVDNTVAMSVNGNSIQLFVKSATASNEIGTALKDSLNNSTEITIKGFTGFYSSSFQVQFKNLVVADSSYTAEDFAQELLDATSNICASSANKENDLAGVWTTFELDKWPTLLADQQEILINAAANENGNVVEQAMARYDLICRKYASCNNYMERSSANHSPLVRPININTTTFAIIASVIIVVSVSAYAMVMLLKKKKEQ